LDIAGTQLATFCDCANVHVFSSVSKLRNKFRSRLQMVSVSRLLIYAAATSFDFAVFPHIFPKLVLGNVLEGSYSNTIALRLIAPKAVNTNNISAVDSQSAA
jgi:hypothetical protein